MANAASLKLMLVGDLILDEPDPDSFFEPSRSTLQQADLLVGHVEVPHTRRGRENTSDVPAPPSEPDHLSALRRAGFHVATLAGNHISDAGPNGIEDTIATLRQLDIATTGAGMNLAEAREPAIVVHQGLSARAEINSHLAAGSQARWLGASDEHSGSMEGASNNVSGPESLRPKGRGGGRASASLPLLDDDTASPASRRLASARPALTPKCDVISARALKVGTLSYNCVGPKDSWAGEKKPGCAYVHVITHYELDHASPGGPPRIYTFAEPESTDAMLADVENLRQIVDVVIVALHKGIGHTPATLAMYERPLAKAAIDAGADIVVGHHAHILRGIEIYKDRPIYHGLGNFVTVTRALNLEANPSPKRIEWARRRRELFGFEPDPNYPVYPFHPEARNAMIAVCEIGADGVRKAGFIPCWVNPKGQPEVCVDDERGRAVASYVEQITKRAGLRTSFEWDGGAVHCW